MSAGHANQPDRPSAIAGGPATLRIGPEHASIPERLASARTHVSKFLAGLFPDGRRAEVGRLIDRSGKHVSRCCNPDTEVSWQLPDTYLLSDEDRVAIAQDILGDRFIVIEAPDASRADSMAAACEMMAEAARLSAHIADAYGDHAIDRAEGAKGYPIAMRVASLALGAAQTFALAMREGVVGLRNVRAIGVGK